MSVLFGFEPRDILAEQIYGPRGAANDASNMHIWTKPPNARMLGFFLLGGGTGGVAGTQGTASGDKAGGSGGGSGAITHGIFPAILIPDRLYLFVGRGGPGGATSAAAGTNGGDTWIQVSNGLKDPSNVMLDCDGGTGGSGGSVSIVSTAMRMAHWGVFLSQAGQGGGSGGAGSLDANGTSVTMFSSSIVSGGAGGGSNTSSGVTRSGGNITAAGLLEANRTGGTGTGNGEDGFTSWAPFWSCGGAGGGSGAVAGRGGSGGYGSGGGGGGGGTTFGAGGKGGDGLIIVTSW